MDKPSYVVTGGGQGVGEAITRRLAQPTAKQLTHHAALSLCRSVS